MPSNRLKKIQKNNKCNYIRVYNAYCVDYNDSEYYFLNRNYKKIGNALNDFVEYPNISKKNKKRIYFYDDNCSPCNPSFTCDQLVENQLVMNKRIDDFTKNIVVSNRLSERNDFVENKAQ